MRIVGNICPSARFRDAQPGRLDLVPKWVRLVQNGTNLGLFKISFLFILAHRAKMNRKLILKTPRFSESK